MGEIASSSTALRAHGAICSPGSIAVHGTYAGLWIGKGSVIPRDRLFKKGLLKRRGAKQKV